MKLADTEKEMLLIRGNILEKFYHDWLYEDTPSGESIKNSISESIATLSRYMGKRKYSVER